MLAQASAPRKRKHAGDEKRTLVKKVFYALHMSDKLLFIHMNLTVYYTEIIEQTDKIKTCLSFDYLLHTQNRG